MPTRLLHSLHHLVVVLSPLHDSRTFRPVPLQRLQRWPEPDDLPPPTLLPPIEPPPPELIGCTGYTPPPLPPPDEEDLRISEQVVTLAGGVARL